MRGVLCGYVHTRDLCIDAGILSFALACVSVFVYTGLLAAREAGKEG
jgi:hypothetical protein